MRKLLDEIIAECGLLSDALLAKGGGSLSELIFLMRLANSSGEKISWDGWCLSIGQNDIHDIVSLVECSFWLRRKGENHGDTHLLTSGGIDYEKLVLQVVPHGKFDPKTHYYCEAINTGANIVAAMFSQYEHLEESLKKRRDWGLALARRCIVENNFRLLESVLEVMAVCSPSAVFRSLMNDLIGFLAHKNRLIWRVDGAISSADLRAICVAPMLNDLVSGGSLMTPFLTYRRGG